MNDPADHVRGWLESEETPEVKELFVETANRAKNKIKRLKRRLELEKDGQDAKRPKRPIIETTKVEIRDVPLTGPWVSSVTSELRTSIEELSRFCVFLEGDLQRLKEGTENPENTSLYDLGQRLLHLERLYAEHQRTFSTIDGQVEHRFKGFFDRLSTIKQQITEREVDARTMDVTISKVQSQIEEVRESVAVLSRKVAEYTRVDEMSIDAKRLENAYNESPKVSTLTLKGDKNHLYEILKAKGLLFTRELLDQCVSFLENGRPILLQGPPGTGKTNLARYLWRAFELQLQGTITLTEADANEHWSSFDLLGGVIPRNKVLVPKLGIVSSAIISCIETNGRNWLIIDELNRAEVDKAFSGLMNLLSDLPDSAYLKHPGFDRPIHVPSAFRVICTMNDADERHLYPLSQAFLSRFARINVGPPPASMHLEILIQHLLELNPESKAEDHDAIRNLAEVLESLKGVAVQHGIAELNFGLRLSRGLLTSAFLNRKNQLAPSIDKQFALEVAQILKELPTQSLGRIKAALVKHRAFPELFESVEREHRARIVTGL